jgi:hypothetical protein
MTRVGSQRHKKKQVVRWDKGDTEPIEDYKFSMDKEWASVNGRIMNTSQNHIKI